jgi:hypothetical protein
VLQNKQEKEERKDRQREKGPAKMGSDPFFDPHHRHPGSMDNTGVNPECNNSQLEVRIRFGFSIPSQQLSRVVLIHVNQKAESLSSFSVCQSFLFENTEPQKHRVSTHLSRKLFLLFLLFLLFPSD